MSHFLYLLNSGLHPGKVAIASVGVKVSCTANFPKLLCNLLEGLHCM